MSVPLDINTVVDDLEAWMERRGLRIDVANRAQDSGCVSYLVTSARGERFFLKRGRAGEPRRSLERARWLHARVSHPALPALRQALECDDGALVLIYDAVDGENLYDYTRLTAAERDSAPGAPLVRLRALPLRRVLDVIATVFEVHVAMEAAGIVAVDFYDGCVLYDFESHRAHLIDLDEYRPGPFRLEAERLPGSKRYMAPEEFRRGAWIDHRTNVFTMGRLATELLGDRLLTPEAWRATPHALAVTRRALSPDPAARYPSVRALVEAFEASLG